MARDVHEREDLLRDAVALSPRIQIRLDDSPATEVFAGFRGNCLSVYFGSSPVYHFNASGDLRRAYVDDRLIKAEKGRIVALRRVQSTRRSELLRTTWDESRVASFLTQLHERLSALSEALASGAYEIVGQVPNDGDALKRLQERLILLEHPRIADSPHVD